MGDGYQMRDDSEARAIPCSITIGFIINTTQIEQLLETQRSMVAQALHH